MSNARATGLTWPATLFYLARPFVSTRQQCRAPHPQAPASAGHRAAGVTQVALQEQNCGAVPQESSETDGGR